MSKCKRCGKRIFTLVSQYCAGCRPKRRDAMDEAILAAVGGRIHGK